MPGGDRRLRPHPFRHPQQCCHGQTNPAHPFPNSWHHHIVLHSRLLFVLIIRMNSAKTCSTFTTSPQHIPFHNPDSILLKLYQSKDNGDTWTYKNSFCFDLVPNTNFYCEVYLFAIGSNLFLRYYSGINNAFYCSNNNGMSWKSVSGINGSQFTKEAYHDNLVSVSSKKSYYAILLDSAFVYSSVDSGMTWTPTSIINVSDTITSYSFFYSINDTLYINTTVYANNGRNKSFKSNGR